MDPDVLDHGGGDEVGGSEYPRGMYVEESGSPESPAIVFIHGAGQSGREWRGDLHIHTLLDRHPDRVEPAIIDGSPPYDAPPIGRELMRLFMVALAPLIH